ncbi:hypothetical protein EVAR_9308_1 [Eumeta japonica]|uniref:ATP-dependent DNA helicase n=1 Tax=Eumeta variegata TaxID=151549 RepID=A0A4C1TNK9_EUMVA|nr:hypothetical protein EVAR_9308_1 [Eumeta japonica]
MAHKRAIEALDRTIKDIKGNRHIMGGMVVLLAGNFRQTLPVINKGTPADEINACLKASVLWTRPHPTPGPVYHAQSFVARSVEYTRGLSGALLASVKRTPRVAAMTPVNRLQLASVTSFCCLSDSRTLALCTIWLQCISSRFEYIWGLFSGYRTVKKGGRSEGPRPLRARLGPRRALTPAVVPPTARLLALSLLIEFTTTVLPGDRLESTTMTEPSMAAPPLCW